MENSNNIISEYIQVRQEIEALEKSLKEKQKELSYLEDVMYFEGEKTLRSEAGTVSVSSTIYASVRKSDFEQFKYFLEKLDMTADDFLEPSMNATAQKKLAKFLEDKQIPDFIKIYEKSSFKLYKPKGG